ncbi:hypothetical protein [Prosthecobacter sp.]|uniref:hypothetical protein n=1 Tax=Prosthecobacter sp. TaxID=1965333 RepID=UPI003783F0B8
MIKPGAKLLFGGLLLAALGSGLALGFLMDYFHGWKFGEADLALEFTDAQSYAVLAFTTLVAALSATPVFRKKKPTDIPDVVLPLFYHVITLTAVLVMGVTSYCILPSSVRNTVFGWGVADFLGVYPTEADSLKKLLVERKPASAEPPPILLFPEIKGTWHSQINIRRISYARRCNALTIHSHTHSRNINRVAVLLAGVDEADIRKVLAEDVWSFEARPVFGIRSRGLVIEWQDITYR